MQGDRVHLVVLKSSGSFLNLNWVRIGVNQPRLRIRRIAPVVYWGESLFFTLGHTADDRRNAAFPGARRRAACHLLRWNQFPNPAGRRKLSNSFHAPNVRWDGYAP